jgi:hypothetical protein
MMTVLSFKTRKRKKTARRVRSGLGAPPHGSYVYKVVTPIPGSDLRVGDIIVYKPDDSEDPFLLVRPIGVPPRRCVALDHEVWEEPPWPQKLALVK